MISLAKEIMNGRRLTQEDDLTVLLEAGQGADMIRRELCGDRMDLCSIINGRGGRCSENCKFCVQSAHNHTNCEEYGFLDTERFVEGCGHAARQGVNRYSIVTAGRTLEGRDLEKEIASYQTMHDAYPNMILCASHGLVKLGDLKRMHEAGSHVSYQCGNLGAVLSGNLYHAHL